MRPARQPARLRSGRGAPKSSAVSAGVAWPADPGADPATLVARADAAMCEAKRRRHAGRPAAQDQPRVRVMVSRYQRALCLGVRR
ncbi:hypothetical protein Ari01nite_03340 [Paractinoplanes rishiriensis]|uniref:Diguanylate cyclase n=1 Tax=Paractinoplanes rishiriensis TaxID=1050105 RepID=A0A919JT65_9ACTN|nr:hypothetical protein Ari01nite_03340 [Actinoplanes rishiriensis]